MYNNSVNTKQRVSTLAEKVNEERNSEKLDGSFAFASLLPELQVKILAQMNVKEVRNFMLVSKEMKSLVEQNMRYLARGNVHFVGLSDGWLNYANGENIGEGASGEIAFKELSEISRTFLWCHIHMLQFNGINLTEEFCDKVRLAIWDANWCIDVIWFYNCRFNPQDNLSAFDNLLSASGASEIIFTWGSSKMYTGNEFLSKYTIKQLELLGMNSELSEDEIINGKYNRLSFERYSDISEQFLKQIIEDWLECKRNIPKYFFFKLSDINVELLLSGLLNVVYRSQNSWTLTNSKGQIGFLYINGNEFRLHTK